MNKIIHKAYPASKLPSELREGIELSATVKVTVEEVARRIHSRDELLEQLTNARRSLKRKVTVEEAVKRIRDLRDEWDD